MSKRANRCTLHDHVCEIHSTTATLTGAIVDFTRPALARGDAVIVISRASRLRAVERRLTPLLSTEKHHRRQLLLLDAEVALACILRGSSPYRDAFTSYMDSALDAAESQGNGQVHVYAEMAGTLWANGNATAAVELERLWNELAERRKFDLFCGYLLDPLDPRSYSDELRSACAAHDSITTTRDDAGAVAALDQACRARLGFSPSTVLPQSQAGAVRWDANLSSMRRAVLWLLKNVPSTTPTILRQARQEALARTAPVRELRLGNRAGIC